MPPPVRAASGLGSPEPWGRWANDTRVAIHFDQPLPSHFELLIVCAVTPANVGRVGTVMAGGCVRRFVCNKTLSKGLESLALNLRPGPGTRTLEIMVPDAEQSIAADGRRLSFALSSLSVTPALIASSPAHG